MSKRLLIAISIFSSFLLLTCYEPVEGCLDTDAVNYNVSADDPCGDCCTFPTLTLGFQHRLEVPKDSSTLRYSVFYPNIHTADLSDSVLFERARYFFSNIKLVKQDGSEVDVIDQLELTFADGEVQTVVDNFAKLDTENFQSRTVGTIKTEGVFTGLNLILGLEEFLLGKEITSDLPSGHPLDTSSDTISFESGTGYIPNLLTLRYDTLLSNRTDEFRFFEPIALAFAFSESLAVEKGDNVRLTLKTNYMDWFEGVDFENDSFQTIEEKIQDNLPNVFSVTEISVN
ncbi:MAG: MbnP family protein [Bacteroidota bacterium]